MVEEQSLQKTGGYTRRIARSRSGFCCRIKKREDRLRRTTRDLRTRTANFIATDGGVFEHLL